MIDQIGLPLAWPAPPEKRDFVLGEANAAAVRHLDRWATWPVMATLLTGPRKSGRSRLAAAFVAKTGGRLFDDAEAHDEEALFHAWNAAQESRKPLVLIASAPPPVWEIALPDLASRLAATPAIAITEPDDILFGALLMKMLAERGLVAPVELVRWVLPRVERSYLSLQYIVEAIDRFALSQRLRLTLPMAKRALRDAGIVDAARAHA